jgi:formiminotetrahydrofolate cyclodeaminase
MAEQLLNMPMTTFLDDLASSKPAPGGGSVAALAGALGAGLISMVCNLTLGKKKYADVEQDINALVARSEKLRTGLQGLLEQDIKVYTELNNVMKMPRDTDAQVAARNKAMDVALKAATGVPMRIAETCAEVMDLCRPAAEKGNANAVSDAGVAILLAEAGLRSAALNVLINLGYLKDEAFVAQSRKHLDDVLSGRPALRDEIYDYVASKL